MTNIVLVGPPRIGKTSIIKAVISKLTDKCEGFYTEEIVEQDERVGFQLVTLTKRSCTLSHRDIAGHVHVGKYGVDLECVEEVGVTAIKKGIKTGKIVVIDEIGKMEILSRSFRLAVLDALDSQSAVVGTMLFKRHPFCDKIRARKDVEVLEVTEGNRDKLVDIIIGKLPK
ncbi:MAG: AAA family ATPase [candidate division WOR-3 bacterium]|nr:MAG: AAA family ATPase [candidate division WOR-3 bacterium]